MKLVEEFVLHDTLNPILFDQNNKLKSDVRQKLLDIVDEFCDFVDQDVSFNIIDVLLVGSQASYNYTDQSDLDLHLVVNLSDICDKCPQIVQSLFNSEKSRFNLNYDINVKGIDVEVYVEDINASTVSNGIYSLYNNDWIKFPRPIESFPEIDQDFLSKLKSEIEVVFSSSSADEVQDMIDQIYLMRKYGLQDGGEFDKRNLAFKQLRNDGYLDRLRDKYYELKSKELSLEGIKIEELD